MNFGIASIFPDAGTLAAHSDSLKGCLVRIVDQAGNVVLDWVSPDLSMKGKDWFNTNPASRSDNNSVIIR